MLGVFPAAALEPVGYALGFLNHLVFPFRISSRLTVRTVAFSWLKWTQAF
jgi:hypothetical protein